MGNNDMRGNDPVAHGGKDSQSRNFGIGVLVLLVAVTLFGYFVLGIGPH